MVNLSVLFKISFVNATGDNRLIINLYRSDRFAVFSKWLLDADVIIRTIRLGTNRLYIAAEINRRVFHAFLFQIVFYAVCNITFGDSAEVNFRMFVCQRNSIAIYYYIVIIDVGKLFVDFCGRWYLFLAGTEIPQAGNRTDGNIKFTFRELSIIKPFFDQTDRIVRNGNSFSFCMINLLYIAFFVVR